MKKKTDSEVHGGSGNVFKDLGYPRPEEALAKAEIIRQISKLIAKRDLTQTEAAALLGIDQPKVSALLRGQVSGFSTERLFRFLNALGRDVEISLRPKSRSRSRGEIRVVGARSTHP